MKNKIIFFIIIFPILFLFSEQKSYAQLMNCSDAGGSCIDDNLFNINQHLLITNSNNADCSPGQVCAKNQPPCVSPATCVPTTQCDGDKITGYCDGSLNTICCSAEYIFNSAYTVTCIGSNNQIFGPYQVNSQGMLLNDNNAIPEIVKHFWPSVKQMTMAWKSMDETQKNNYLEYIENNYGVRCKIEEIINNHVYGALDETPPKSEPLKFTSEVGIPTFKGEQTVDGGLLGKFAKVFYSYLLGLSGIVCVIILILAGFQWVTAGGNQNKIGEAKERIKNVITGLVLLASSYLIMYTINPELVKIKVLEIEYIDGITTQEGDAPDFGSDYNESVVANNGANIPEEKVSIFMKNRNFFDADFNSVFANLPTAKAVTLTSTGGCPIRQPVANGGCHPQHILNSALSLRYQVAGPCHCACFVSGNLMYAGCINSTQTSVSTFMTNYLDKDTSKWEKYTGDRAKMYYPSPGDIIAQTSSNGNHIEIVLYTDSQHGIVWVIHSTPFGDSYGSCQRRSNFCENRWHNDSLDGKGETLYRNSSCKNNQAVLITRDLLYDKPNYVIYRNKKNNYHTFGSLAESAAYRDKNIEDNFIKQYGNPNYRGGDRAYRYIMGYVNAYFYKVQLQI